MRISPFAKNFLRKRATDVMDDECIITRPGVTRTTYDPATRVVRTVSGLNIYEGVCRLWEVSEGQHIVIGAEEYTTASLMLSIPWDSTLPLRDDLISITKYVDSSMVGRSLIVTGLIKGGGLRSSRVMRVDYVEKKI